MTGKIFAKSSNIYQDQAKILFDYYRQAAEAIVSAEMHEEQNKSDLTAARNAAIHKQNVSKIVMIILFSVGGILLILGLIINIFLLVLGLACLGVGIYFLVTMINSKKDAVNYEQMISQSNANYANIRREYSVDKIGVVYVPVATRVPFENKSFILDHTGTVAETGFRLTILNEPEEFQESVEQLTDTLKTIPVVEKNEQTETVNTSEYSVSVQNLTLNDYIGNIDRQVRNISFLLSDNRDVSVRLPVVKPISRDAENIKIFATSETGNYPVVNAFDVSFEDRIEKFTSLNALKDQISGEDDIDSNEYMKNLMRRLAETVQLFTRTKVSGSGKLAEYTSGIFNTVLKSGYTQYSPQLEAEEIERIRLAEFDYKTAANNYTPFSLNPSSVVKYELFSRSWVAEDGSRTSMPFGMHQIDEEIFMPVIAMLMEENKIERMRIYNSIEDQKRMYLERWTSEVGNYFRDNRKTADELITHMRETYADYMNAYTMYKSLDNTSGAMKQSGRLADGEVQKLDTQAEMIAGFQLQAEQCNKQQEEFADFMDRIQDSIQESTQEFGHIEYYEASLRDCIPHETARAFASIRELDPRHRNLVAINPYIANCAELPPEPKVSPELYEHISIDLLERVEADVGYVSENIE